MLMDREKGVQIIGNTENPFHLSVGIVLVNGIGTIALIKKSTGSY